MVGRNGVFYDRQGDDWDATITKIIDNPISIRQAFWSPYKKFVRLIEEQVAKRAAAARRGVAQDARRHGDDDRQRRPRQGRPRPRRWTSARWRRSASPSGAIGTFFTALIGYAPGRPQARAARRRSARSSASWPLISLPSVVLAWLKLRKRNLGPILDANGWAVNAKAKLNIPFGATLTSVAKLPPGSKRDNRDPYAEKAFPWKRILLVAAVLTSGYQWYRGNFDRYLPETFRASSVFGWPPSDAPAKK